MCGLNRLDGEPLNQQDILGLYVSLSGNFKIALLNCSTCGAIRKPSQAAGQ